MGRYRSRSRSYSPRRRKRYDDPRESRSRKERRNSPPSSSGLLVRNLPLDARPEELRFKFEKFGTIRDVYLPKHYYTGEPRGFGFVKYRNPEDAAEAKYHLDNTVIGGREIRIVFAEENRRAPNEMRRDTRVSDRGSYRRRSPVRSPRRRYRSSSHSPSPDRSDRNSLERIRGRKAGGDRYSPHRSRSVSKSLSPRDERDHRSDRKSLRRSRSISRLSSPIEKKSLEESSRSPRDKKKFEIGHGSRSPSGDGQAREAGYDDPSRSPSPGGKACSLSRSHRSASPGGDGQRSADERSPIPRRKAPSPRGNGRKSRDKRYGEPDKLPSLRGKVRNPANSRSPSYSPH